jgi:uncharacterized membrane protein YhaH (DUF805 family)
MKGRVLHYDDNAGNGQISGDDGIRYSFTRADLKQLIPIRAGTVVDFDFEGRTARDIYVASAMPGVGASNGTEPYYGEIEPDLGFFGYFGRAITSYYANFSGRARRKEYWSFMVVPVLVMLVLGLIFGGLMAAAQGDPSGAGPGVMVVGAIFVIFLLAIIIPSLAVSVRRLHDIGQSGWLILILVVIGLIPYLGILSTIGYIVLGIIDGQTGSNKYGPPVKRQA